MHGLRSSLVISLIRGVVLVVRIFCPTLCICRSLWGSRHCSYAHQTFRIHAISILSCITCTFSWIRFFLKVWFKVLWLTSACTRILNPFPGSFLRERLSQPCDIFSSLEAWSLKFQDAHSLSHPITPSSLQYIPFSWWWCHKILSRLAFVDHYSSFRSISACLAKPVEFQYLEQFFSGSDCPKDVNQLE